MMLDSNNVFLRFCSNSIFVDQLLIYSIFANKTSNILFPLGQQDAIDNNWKCPSSTIFFLFSWRIFGCPRESCVEHGTANVAAAYTVQVTHDMNISSSYRNINIFQNSQTASWRQ